MAIDLGKKSKPSQAAIKLFLKQKIDEHVNKLKIERALARENINRAIGVGDFETFEKEFETDYARTSSKRPKQPRKAKLTKLSSNLKGVL